MTKRNKQTQKPPSQVRVSVPKNMTAAQAKALLKEGPGKKLNGHDFSKSNHVELPQNLTKDGVETLLQQLSDLHPGETINLQMGTRGGFWIGDLGKSISERATALTAGPSKPEQFQERNVDEAREKLNLNRTDGGEKEKADKEIGYFTTSFVQLTGMASHLSVMLERTNDLVKRLDGEQTESPRSFVKAEDFKHLSDDQKEWPVKEKLKVLTLILDANGATLQLLNSRLSKLVM